MLQSSGYYYIFFRLFPFTFNLKMGNICCPSFVSCFTSKDEYTPDVSVLCEVIKDTGDIEELIFLIEQSLEALPVNTTASRSQQDPSTSQQNAGSSQEPVVASSKMKSCVTFGRDLFENVAKRVQKDASKRSFRVKLGDKTRTLIIDILKEYVTIPLLGVGLSVLGYVLEEIDQDSANNEQCVKLLSYMLALAKHVRLLKEELPEDREKLKDVVNFIVKGCVMCVSQMKNHSLFRLIYASVDAEEIKNFEDELGHQHQDLTMEAVIGLLNRTPQFLPPTQGQKPDAVGIEKTQDIVTRLLQVEVNDQFRKIVVVIYGFGGVGKTTLATAIFSQLNLKAYKFCKLLMEESCSSQHIMKLQRQLLNDLFGENIKLRNPEEGQEEITNSFKKASSQPVFMFIDNALKESDLAKLLPTDLSCLPKQTRILLTTRRRDECRNLFEPAISGIQWYDHKVDFLKEADSRKILCKKALGSVDATFYQDVDIDGFVKICGGIPLVLDLVGSKLRLHVSNPSTRNGIDDFLRDLRESLIEGEGDEGEEISKKVVDVVYNSLDTDSKEAFLDIACFYYNRERMFVSYVVEDPPLKTLVDAALVKLSYDPPTSSSLWRDLQVEDSGSWHQFIRDRDIREGFLEVHDIVRARGRKLSQRESDRRIMDEESWAEAVQDTQNLHKIKGICITSPKPQFQIDAQHLDLMHASLRTLYIGRKIKINGKCQNNFKSLRCIYLASDTCFCVDLAKLKHLRVLRAELSNNPTEFPSSLRWLELGPESGFQLVLNESFNKLPSLQELHLKNDVVLPPKFGHLQSLSLLSFVNCKMVTLPESFGSLSALEGLSIYGCEELESLPKRFGELQKLAFLEVSNCPKLSSLSENFGQLTSLRILNLDFCDGLSTLPKSFGNLPSLEELSLRDCSNLVSLPESFGNLSSHLKQLDMRKCSHLKEEAMDVLVKMNNLEYLNIGGSPRLIKRWEEAGAGQPKLASGNSVSLSDF